MPQFSERFKELRISRGLSQQALADQLGFSKSSVNMYERGEREPGFESMEAIADYFNVDLDYLLGRSDIPNRSTWLHTTHEGTSPSSAADRPAVTDDDIKFALFGGDGEITDAMYDEVKRFAEFVKQRNQRSE